MTDEGTGGAQGTLEEAKELASRHFGIDLGCYPRSRVQALLDRLGVLEDTDLYTRLSRMVATLCVGETFFLRHPEHFQALRRVLPELIERATPLPLKIWSAGCASGEEAYTLAATLKEHCPDGLEVLGTDANEQFLERARERHYLPWSLRGVESLEVRGWLEPDGGGFRVVEEVARLVRFRKLNLIHDPFPRAVSVILCRNVLLYFTREAANQVFEEMYRAAEQGAVLILGSQDPRPAAETGWVRDRVGDVTVFRKTSGPSLVDESIPPEKPAPVQDDAIQVFVRLVRDLAGQRQFNAALAIVDELVVDRPLDPEPLVLGAMVADEAGKHGQALDFARKASFLAPDEAITAFLMGRCLDGVGERGQANLYFEQARDALDSLGDRDKALPLGEGLTPGQLRRMIDGRS